jgi:mono/diheme cytochrome c family protein
MTPSRRMYQAAKGLYLPLLGFAMLGAISTGVSAQTDDPLSSLPGGPKDLLGALSSDAAVIGELVGSERSSEKWVAHLTGMGTAMTDDQLAILADYLALNVPAETSGTDVAAILGELPPDGRELFAANCFSCHGVASYYLLQDRDEAGWMDIFGAPYHRRLLPGDNERETFASYAAHAMPIPADAIPEAWKQ